MSKLMDSIRYLAKDIGPRPAGTSEEQSAALYLTEQFQKRSGFSAGIEEFQRRSRPDLSYAILGALMIVISVLAMVFSVLAIPAFILGAAASAVYIIELLGTPLLSRVLASGTSQNVIAKYQPNTESATSQRAVSRKIILVAHYDSGRVTPSLLKTLGRGKVSLYTIGAGAMVVETVLLLLRIFIAISGGGVLVILNVLSIIVLLVCALPILIWFLKRGSAFNEGANNNASGSAALVEVAERISKGSVSEADLIAYAGDVTLHGASAAHSAGLVPEGIEFSYEATADIDLETATEEERLLAAKAAIAALTGRPVARRVYSSVTEETISSSSPELSGATAVVTDDAIDGAASGAAGPGTIDDDTVVMESDSHGSITQISDEEFATAFREYRTGSFQPVKIDANKADANAESFDDLGETTVMAHPNASDASDETEDMGGFHNVPSWFAAAQKNAKRNSSGATVDIHRSRYTEAMENAERERNRHEEELDAAAEAAREAERLAREAEAAAAIAAAAEQRAAAAAAAAQKQEEAQEGASQDTPAPGSEVVVDAAPENEVEEGKSGSMPRVAGAPVMGVRETAVEAELLSETTVDAIEEAKKDTSGFVTTVSEEAATTEDAENTDASASSEDKPVSRLERLRNLRTAVPSLSGVIRTKDEARKAAVRAVPDVRTAPASVEEKEAESETPKARPNISQELPEIDLTAPAEPEAPRIIDEPTETSEAAFERSATNALDPIDAIDAVEEVDYDMVVTTDFNPQVETDFADSLIPESNSQPSRKNDFNAPIMHEVPRKKSSRFFDRFRSKKEQETMESPQEWLGVDDDFEARKVGRARGSWESFRTDDGEDSLFTEDHRETFDDFSDDTPQRRRWEGGSASRRSLGHVDMRSGEDAEAYEPIPDTPPEAENRSFVTGEMERIYHFRNPAFNTEIWFVAIGSDDVDSHDGAYAFLDEHKTELRGSTVIEIESLGAGTLSVASREGAVQKVSASSRIKRYVRDVVASTGISLDEVDMSGVESIASIVQKAGFQSMHLFGAENGRPALKGSANDIVENIDEVVLNDYVNFVYELLKR